MPEENPKEDREKKEQKEKEQEKEKAKEKDKGKAAVGEKKLGTIETRSPPRKKSRLTKPTYQAVFHDEDFNTLTNKVCDNMT